MNIYQENDYEEYKKFLKSDDALFHYTKKLVAIENILLKKEFRLSTFSNANDPFEYTDKGIVSGVWGLDALKKSCAVEEKINEIIKSELYFISCCENCFVDGKIKTEGFEKTRMWAQYGDNHEGVCFVFSKECLEKYLKEKESEKILKIISNGRILYNETIDDEYELGLEVDDANTSSIVF